MTKNKPTHIDDNGNVKMVDITEKPETKRFAMAQGTITMNKDAFELLVSGRSKKGEIFPVARVAGIMAAKKTHELIPLCHPIKMTSIDINFELDEKNRSCRVISKVSGIEKTGFEMEALTAAAVALLTIYDMLKAVDRGISINNITLLEKYGGKSGHFINTDTRE